VIRRLQSLRGALVLGPHQGGFGLGASIFGAVFFGLGAFFAGHYVATGRHYFAKLS
jgi:hypothetical protein